MQNSIRSRASHIRILGIRTPWRRAWITSVLLVLVMLIGAQLTPLLQRVRAHAIQTPGEQMQEPPVLATPIPTPPATPAADGVTLATVMQDEIGEAALAQAAHRKGVIWLPHAKWAREGGFYWPGIEGDLQDMQRAGIGWVRIFLRQDLPMEFHDRLVVLLERYNIQLLPVVKKTDPQGDLGTLQQQAAYLQWLTEVVTRYHGSVRYWEIENETNIPQGWAICCHNDPEQQEAYARSVGNYVVLLKMAYETIKGIDPTLQVLIAGLCEAGAERYIEELIRLNAHRYFDIMSYHPFSSTPDGALARLEEAKVAMAAQPELAAKPIWITALGYHSQSNWTAPGRVANEEVKADYLLQTMQMLSESSGVEGPLFWYAFSEPTTANGYGLLRIDPNATPSKYYLPAFAALRELWATKHVAILTATADSFVSRNYPTANYGSAEKLRIGYGTDIREAHLKFDLGPLAGHSLLQTQLRFLTASMQSAGSADSQMIRMVADALWTEQSITYNNRLSSIVGVIDDTEHGRGYQVTLDSTLVQGTTGGQLSLTIDSQGADELIIHSREWVKNPPKLIVYYTEGALSAAAPEVIVASADELEEIEEIAEPSSQIVEDLYAWADGDPYSGYTYEMWDEEERNDTEQQVTPDPSLYLPFIEQ